MSRPTICTVITSYSIHYTKLYDSLIAAANGEPAPENGYAGAYVVDIARQVLAQAPDAMSLPDAERRETFRGIGVDLMFTHIKASLHEFGTDFDVFTP